MNSTAIKETGLLMTSPLVTKTLAGVKTQTRRVKGLERVNESPDDWCAGMVFSGRVQFNNGASHHPSPESFFIQCPYGMEGDRIYIKEKHSYLDVTRSAVSDIDLGDQQVPETWELMVEYSDGTEALAMVEGKKPKQTRERGENKWRPSIFMHKWASRLRLEITRIRVERLNEISEEDAQAEGAEMAYYLVDDQPTGSYDEGFAQLWEKINGEGSWRLNPWVWVIDFKRV